MIPKYIEYSLTTFPNTLLSIILNRKYAACHNMIAELRCLYANITGVRIDQPEPDYKPELTGTNDGPYQQMPEPHMTVTSIGGQRQQSSPHMQAELEEQRIMRMLKYKQWEESNRSYKS